ncbi:MULTISPECIES: hypothetical protein [Saccharibacillus]|uniref:hypothetical protein n=1 Tax=Saccharibacillus TaxID=456492 RepID=UPI0012385201|nr:hypothetical protein [Saccharibacillus sp. WB 17]MWJ30558.1 hypothetical protein [Saccharibacillus sp. WB 17]
MRLKELQEMMLIPDREILLNRLVTINNTEVLLISITSEQQGHKLWMLSRMPETPDAQETVYRSEEPRSNREKIQQQTDFGHQEDFISQMIIQGQTLTFHSSESNFITEQDFGAYMKLQHFVEKGADFTSFADVELNRLCLTVNEQDPSLPFPDLDLDKELDITLKFDGTVRSVPVQIEPIVLEFGEVQPAIQYSFHDSVHDKSRFFYINAVTRYDIWQEALATFEKPMPQGYTDKEWQSYQDQYRESLESAYSKNEELVLVEYESEDDIQLNFYAQDHLDAKPRSVAGSGDLALFFKPDRELGPHGLKSRICMVGPVDKEFGGSVTVELLSGYVELPEKVIKL